MRQIDCMQVLWHRSLGGVKQIRFAEASDRFPGWKVFGTVLIRIYRSSSSSSVCSCISLACPDWSVGVWSQMATRIHDSFFATFFWLPRPGHHIYHRNVRKNQSIIEIWCGLRFWQWQYVFVDFSVANKCCAHLWKVKELERSAWGLSFSERIVYEKDGVLVSDYKLKALKRCKFQQSWAIKALTSGCSSTSQWYFYHSDLILSLTLDFNHWFSNNPPCHLLHPFSLISHHLRSNGDYSKNRKRSKFLLPDVEKKRFKQFDIPLHHTSRRILTSGMAFSLARSSSVFNVSSVASDGCKSTRRFGFSSSRASSRVWSPRIVVQQGDLRKENKNN